MSIYVIDIIYCGWNYEKMSDEEYELLMEYVSTKENEFNEVILEEGAEKWLVERHSHLQDEIGLGIEILKTDYGDGVSSFDYVELGNEMTKAMCILRQRFNEFCTSEGFGVWKLTDFDR